MKLWFFWCTTSQHLILINQSIWILSLLMAPPILFNLKLTLVFWDLNKALLTLWPPLLPPLLPFLSTFLKKWLILFPLPYSSLKRILFYVLGNELISINYWRSVCFVKNVGFIFGVEICDDNGECDCFIGYYVDFKDIRLRFSWDSFDELLCCSWFLRFLNIYKYDELSFYSSSSTCLSYLLADGDGRGSLNSLSKLLFFLK